MKTQDIKIANIEVQENIRTRVGQDTIEPLMESIKQHGLKQAIGVGLKNDGSKEPNYVLIWGYRRLQAYIKLGYNTIPAVVESEPTFTNLLIINAVENLQRKDINPDDLGRVCHKLLELGLGIGEIAIRLGQPKSRIQQSVGIYKRVPADIRKRVAFIMPGNKERLSGRISATAMSKILAVAREFALKDETIRELSEVASKEDLTTKDLAIIGMLMQLGYTLKEAMIRRTEYKILYLSCLVSTKELNKRIRKYKVGSAEVMRRIVHGEIPPMKRVKIT